MNWFAALLDLFERIPPLFWGVVVGSFFSLGGVVLTNRANDRRLRAQLAHDRDLKNRDRELSLRKEVYLAAAEAIFAGFISVTKFANLEIAHDKITETYLEKAPAIAKIHVIAQEETARALARFSGELGAVYLRLFAKRVPLGFQKQQLTMLDRQIVGFANERDRMLELMKQYNLEGATDQRRWKVIQDNFDFEQRRVAESSKQREALAATLYATQLEYMKECISETTKLSRLLVPVIVAVRTELDLPIDEATYLQIIEEAIEKQQASLAEFLQQARGFIAAQPGAAGDAAKAAP
ncbi:MAG TPA: hypothetical protein VHE58_01130 [Burkholderiales bacterium]|nr:hypothetical protein [Burkholderiales bacterium]